MKDATVTDMHVKLGRELATWIDGQAKFHQIPSSTQARMILAKAMRAWQRTHKTECDTTEAEAV